MPGHTGPGAHFASGVGHSQWSHRQTLDCQKTNLIVLGMSGSRGSMLDCVHTGWECVPRNMGEGPHMCTTWTGLGLRALLVCAGTCSVASLSRPSTEAADTVSRTGSLRLTLTHQPTKP